MNDLYESIEIIISKKKVEDLNNSEKKEIIQSLKSAGFNNTEYADYLIKLTPNIKINFF